jgi:molecular chaperone DnaJ
MDLYGDLGIDRSATADDIKQKYHQLARQLHPDRNPDPAAEEQLKQASDAYGVLSDKLKRRMYDWFVDYLEKYPGMPLEYNPSRLEEEGDRYRQIFKEMQERFRPYFPQPLPPRRPKRRLWRRRSR